MLIRCEACFEEYDNINNACTHCEHVPGDPPVEIYHLYPGMVLRGRYIVGKVLGYGGFGITYKVWDRTLNAVRAIKEYYPSGLVNRVPGTQNVILYTRNRSKEYNHGLVRFLDEARSMARFSTHSSIINVFDHFEENNTAYIVMEFLDGINLSEYMKMDRLDLDACIEIGGHICEALREIHKAGIVHRDVSPDNIFICTGNVIKLIDFGAARFADGGENLMTVILKPGFAPPEQYLSKSDQSENKISKQDPRTDIYALGATLYMMVTGIKPEESTNRKIQDTLASPNEVDVTIPEYMSNLIMKAMAVEKHLRFNNIEEVEAALNQEKKVEHPAKEKKKRWQRRLLGIGSVAVILVVATVIFLTVWNKQRVEETLPDADITLWYIVASVESEGAEVAEATEAAEAAEAVEAADTSESAEVAAVEQDVGLAAVVAAFAESFPNVNITLVPHSAEDYRQELRAAIEAGTAPTLFQSDGLESEYLSGAVDLSRFVAALGGDDYLFLDDYSAKFPRQNQLPLGFTAPCVYVNTGLLPDLTGEFKYPDDLPKTEDKDMIPFAVSAEAARSFLFSYNEDPEHEKLLNVEALDLFLSGKVMVLFSGTESYLTVQAAMPARYRVMPLDSAKVLGEFTGLWSLGECKSNEQKVAERFLAFMLSDNAQDILHIQNPSNSAPINKNVLEVYCEVYHEFAEFYDNTDAYVFAAS